MDNYSKVIELLKKYKMIQITIENLEQEINYVKEDTELRGISYDGISTSPTNEIKSIVESTVLGNIEKMEYLEHLIKRHKIDIDKLEKALGGLEEIERQIVTEKYCEGKQWYVVSYNASCSESTAKRYRRDAIKKMAIAIFGEK